MIFGPLCRITLKLVNIDGSETKDSYSITSHHIIVLALLVAFLHLVGLLFNSQQSIIIAVFSFASIAFIAVFHHYQHYYCRISSSYLLFYWLWEFIFTCMFLRSNFNDGLLRSNLPYFIILVIRATMSLTIFVLETVPKPPSFYQS